MKVSPGSRRRPGTRSQQSQATLAEPGDESTEGYCSIPHAAGQQVETLTEPCSLLPQPRRRLAAAMARAASRLSCASRSA